MKHARIRLPRAAVLGALGFSLAVLSSLPAHASSFEGRLAAGPSYLWLDTRQDISDSEGPALSTQLDTGLRLLPALAIQAALFYDLSSWMDNPNLLRRQDASVLGLGLGVRIHLDPIVVGGAAGAQLTWFPQNNDPADTYGAGLGPFVSVSAGYEWALGFGASHVGLHASFRAQRSSDETNATVYDPVGYQVALALSFGLDGEPLLGP